MIACLVLCVVVLVGQRLLAPRLSRNLMRTLLLCAVILGAGLIMVAKQPHPYYLVPEMAYVCLGNTILVSLLFGDSRIPMWLRTAGIALLFAILAAQAIRYESHYTRGDAAETMAIQGAVARAEQRGA